MNLRECVWETRYRMVMKTILQEKVRIHYSTTNYEKSCSESSGGQGMGIIGEIFGVEPDESQK